MLRKPKASRIISAARVEGDGRGFDRHARSLAYADRDIDALNAGKDVYIEKPLTRTIEEGPLIVKAARINERVCQVGMQQRSQQHYLQAKREYFNAGKLGKITLARTWQQRLPPACCARLAPDTANQSRLGAF